MIGRGRRRRSWRWSGLSLLGWMLVLAVSCTGTIEKSPFEQESPDLQQQQERVSFTEMEFHFAMEKLENGDFSGTRETLSEIPKRDEDNSLAPKVAFALGVLQLLEMDDVARMSECRDYFQAFSDQHPGGPYRENADRIVHILSGHIERAKREQKRIKELTQQVTDQDKVIQTLRYKIEKLEEIHQETEEKRRLPEEE
jgi:hypothetical protein